MTKRFKAKNKRKGIKIIFIMIIFLMGFYFTIKFLLNNKLKKEMTNETLVNYLLYSGSNGLLGNDELFSLIQNFNLKDPSYMVSRSLNNYLTISKEVFNEDETIPNLEIKHYEDPNKRFVNEPLLYLFNTHQKEAYYTNNILEYNITPTVLMASYIMKEKFNDLGIKTIVEETDITGILHANSWQYKYSYDASKMLIKSIKEKDPSLKYFVDIHRDSSKRYKTITEIDNLIYARVLFVVGLEHDNYEKNLEIATNLNNLITSKYPTLSRGIYKKSGAGVNGIYNQDLSPNMVLLELGGQYNSIDEVNNTINLIVPIISDYIKERENIAN